MKESNCKDIREVGQGAVVENKENIGGNATQHLLPVSQFSLVISSKHRLA